ncbi:TylF/MycF/NovP-related O-methyltransferase [Leptospira mayottensis]|uniref:Macrocin-O-methyltransferase TylF n=2 Tax=Leptospira mayottensis TaxID=1137606 RepID=A0AA87MLH5_9LEPT|nr:TylF/MycF/NovP-related O-methyltransferase [Leptospira mayottensis]AXR64986.1 macrocin-O-methyltransferase [Leptospira mayottensis]EKR99468.1 macrocin-O-methyltransferase TylF [Leptospira mayottensis 200901122]
MSTFDGFKKSNVDIDIEEKISSHIEKYLVSGIDILKHSMVLTRRQWFKRLLAHIELFKMTLDVPGDIAELGVFRGIGLMTWANLLESYCIGDRTKVVWGFDNWKGFTSFELEDGSEIKDAQKKLGGFNPEFYYNELVDAIKIFDQDRFIPNKPRIKLQEGQIEESIPRFIKENPGVRFSLIHFDCDLYAPTKVALEYLYPLLSKGGVMLFDEYGIHDWPGETKAVDEFLERNENLKLHKFSWTNAPAAYLIK